MLGDDAPCMLGQRCCAWNSCSMLPLRCSRHDKPDVVLSLLSMQGVPSALILPHPPPMVVTANVVSDSEILAPGREGHGLLLALAGCSSKEGKWYAAIMLPYMHTYIRASTIS